MKIIALIIFLLSGFVLGYSFGFDAKVKHIELKYSPVVITRHIRAHETPGGYVLDYDYDHSDHADTIWVEDCYFTNLNGQTSLGFTTK